MKRICPILCSFVPAITCALVLACAIPSGAVVCSNYQDDGSICNFVGPGQSCPCDQGCTITSGGLCDGFTNGSCDFSQCPGGFLGSISISPNGGSFPLSSPPAVSYTYTDIYPQLGGAWAVYYLSGGNCPTNSPVPGASGATATGSHSVPVNGASCGAGLYRLDVNASDGGGESGNISAVFNLQIPVNLNFHVTDTNNQPIPGALITIGQDFGNGTTQTTDGSGNGNFVALSMLSISFTVSASGFNNASGSASVGTTAATQNVQLTPAVIARYRCSGANTCIRDDANGNFTDPSCNNSCAPANSPPTITAQPANASVLAGQSATFTITATGTPAPTYQWRRNGAAVAGATSASYTTPATVIGDNGALFSCIVTNSQGSVTSNNATLTVTSGNSAPVITQQPANASVNVGQTATFTISATGTPAPTYQWRRNGAAVAGATSASYTTPATVIGDNGALFSCIVTNSQGSVTSNNATLTVTPGNSVPVITQQPVNISVAVGQPAMFTVAATGTPAPSYQWHRNGIPISGAASASYTLTSAALIDSGAVFFSTAKNSAGAVSSSSATLTVTSGPSVPVINSAPSATGVVGSPFTYQITATNTPTSYNATNLPTGLTVNTNTGLIAGTPRTSGTTTATISASNAAGPGSRSLTITINPQNSQASAPLLTNAFAYPSPYKPSVHGNGITFSNLNNDPSVVIKIYTIKGELVQELRNTGSAASIQWIPVTNRSGEVVASGVYVYRIKSNTDEKTGKLIIAR